MVTITLKGREVPLLYTTWELKQIQEEIGPLGIAICKMTGRNPDDENDASMFADVDHLKSLAKMIRILGNAGLEETGGTPDLTDKKIMRAIRPDEIMEMSNICLECLLEGMRSEIPEKAEDGPVDVTLEKMQKKKEKES